MINSRFALRLSRLLALFSSARAILLSRLACGLFFTLAPAGFAALPAGWSDADIGSPAETGSASYDNGIWTVAGGGADIWGASDNFHFAYTPVAGDGYIVAKVTGVDNTDGWAKGGVMFRNDATAPTLFANVVATPGNGVSFQWRSTANTDCGYSSATASVPVWVKLVRAGSVFSGFYSTDGQTWIQIGSPQTIAMNNNALAGLCVTAHNDMLLCQATFSGVDIPANGPSAAQVVGVYRELWTGLDPNAGNNLFALTNSVQNPNWPNKPNASYTKIYPVFETESNTGLENYGQRLRAFVIPPTNGVYSLWIASDDSSALFLSSDENPANATQIASVNSWTASRIWTTEPNQQSAAISLIAGRRYYLEAVMQQGGGGDDLAVRWQLPDESFEEPIPAMVGSRIRMIAYTGASAVPGIFQQSTNVTAMEGTDAALSILVTNQAAVNYQWRLNGVNLTDANANKSVYTVSNVTQALMGGTYVCVAANASGSVTSAPISLNVVHDATLPVVTRVVNAGLTSVQVSFSKTMEVASATQSANYVIASGLKILAAALSDDGKTVTLTTDPMVLGNEYTLVINGVRDRATVPNTIAAGTTVKFSALPYTFQEIGSANLSSSTVIAGNGIDVTATGGDVSGPADQIAFNSQTKTSDFDVCVRVAGMTPADTWSKAGLMARDATSSGSRFVAAMATPAMSGSFFAWRDPAGGNVNTSGSFPVNYPATWLRLRRSGNTFTGYAGYDGKSWTSLGSAIIAMPSTLYVGLTVSSHNGSQSVTAQFRDFAATTGATLSTPINPHEALAASSRKTPIVFSEIMYKPAKRADTNHLEFVEIYNSNPFLHDIGGYQIIGDNLSFTFPKGTIIPGGGFMVVAASPQSMSTIYGLSNVFGYSGNLKKSDHLQLLDEVGAVLLTVPFQNKYPWPVGADGSGHSMVLAYPSYGEGDPRAWDNSAQLGGSPGAMETFLPNALRNVVINEWLAHTEDPTLLDFVELYNHSNQANDISGCILTDDASTNQFVIPPGTVIAPGGFVSYDQSQLGFGLSAKGQNVYFLNPDGSQILDVVQFEPQADGVSFGRWPDGANAFYPLAARTPGAANSAILSRDIVINELMYHPITGDDDDQFIELYNRGANTISLAKWKFTSGVDFDFPANCQLAPDSYLVIARNPERLLAKYSNLSSANTFGPFNGHLSHNGARVALAMPQPLTGTDDLGQPTTNIIYVVEDEVTYGTGGRWGKWAAGGGSSLELINPDSNRRLAANWADSDDTAKSTWVNIESTGVLDNGGNYDPAIDYAQIGLLDEGECLVDGIEVRSGVSGANIAANPDFENGLTSWSLQGCMSRSSLENTGYNSAHSLHIRCSDRIWTGANSCQVALTSTSLQPGLTATLRFKARWLHGWPEALLRLNGNWLEATGSLPVPANLGTPGQRNSRYVANAGPALYEVAHTPVVPAANQPVVVTARVHDPNGVQNIVLKYRLDPNTSYTSVPMVDTGTGGDAVAGDGIYSATIPGKAAGVVAAFYISAADNKGEASQFPALINDNAPVRECVVMFGDGVPGGCFPVCRLWITQTNATRWANLSDLSNEGNDCTIVVGNRAIYNAQARFTGSPYHQGFDMPYGNLCHYKWMFPDDDKYLGATSFNKIHQPGNGAGDDASMQREQVANSLLRALGVPWLNRRFVVVYVNGNRRGQLMEDAQTPDSDVLKEQFPKDDNGYLYKMQPWFEFGPFPQGYSIPFNNNSWCNFMPYTTTGGAFKTARYRYNFLMRSTPGSASDYTNIFKIVNAASTYGSANYVANMENMADMENWMRVFAANHAAGNWDSVGAQNAQNMYGYIGTQGTKYTLLMFDFNISIGNSGSWGPGQNLFAVNGQDPNTQNIYNEPAFRRMYWRALQELVDGPLNVANSGPLIDAKYKTMVASGMTVESSSVIKNWLTSAHDSIASQIAGENTSTFKVNTPAITNNVAYLTGTAPVAVKTIWINGVEYPVLWTSVIGWSLSVPLLPGTNNLQVAGVDTHGQSISNASQTVVAVYSGPASSPVGKVVINEIMFNPAAPGAEYVELFNNSSNVSFELSGWKLHGISYTFPQGTFINPTNYLVLAANKDIFANTYGASIPVFDNFSGTLQPDGETLALLQPASNGGEDVVVSKVRYGNAAPWPNGAGASLQLVDAHQDNWRVGNWSNTDTNAQWVYATANIGKPSSASQPFYIYSETAGDIYIDDLKLVRDGTTANVVTNGDFESALTGPWTVTANFSQSTASSGLKHSGNSSLHLVATAGGAGSGNSIYQTIGTLDPNSSYTLSFWYLPSANCGKLTLRFSGGAATALVIPPSTATGSNLALFTPGSPNTVAASLAPFPTLWLNEVQAENVSGPVNSGGQRTGWIELYNGGTNSVALSGLYLANNYTNLTQWTFPAGAAIQPGEFKVIFADGETNLSTVSELHTSFVLPSGVGSVALTRLGDSGKPQVLDFIDYTNLAPNHSFGSFPDGQSFDRQDFFYATPGATNNGASAPLTVAINEWMSSNTRTLANPVTGAFDDWFELYNYGANTVDLSGYYLSRSLTNTTEFAIPAGYTIPAHGFLLVWADKKNTMGKSDLHAGFKLSKSGASICLFGVNGTLIDAVTYGPQASDSAMGRYPDGGPNILVLASATPATNNAPPQVAPSIPAGFNVVAGDGQVMLSWLSASGAATYNVKRSSTDGGPYTPVGVASNTNYIDTSLINGSTYYYVVSAVNPVGESGDSLQVMAQPRVAVPTVPTGLVAMAGNAQVSLQWNSTVGATNYNVKRSAVNGGPYILLISGTMTSYTDTAVSNGTNYYYVVSASNGGGESANSAPISATPQPPAPAVPSGLTAVAGDAKVTLSWTSSTGATNYNVKRATVSSGPLTLLKSASVTSYTDTAVSNGTNYYYVVSASNGGGESANSAPISATPQSAAPAVPTGLTAVAGDAQVTLSWQSSSGASTYNLKRSTANGGPYDLLSSGASTSYTDAAVSNGTNYYYVVSAANGGVESANSAPVTAMPHGVATLSVSHVSTKGQLSLAWPAWAASYVPFETPSLTLLAWKPLANAAQNVGGQMVLILPTTNGVQRYFKLQAP